MLPIYLLEAWEAIYSPVHFASLHLIGTNAYDAVKINLVL